MLGRLAADRDTGAPNQPVLAQYVAPSAWAFPDAHTRAGRLAGMLDELLLLLPFEEKLYRDAGVSCTFVGHPSVEAADGWAGARRGALASGQVAATDKQTTADSASLRLELGLPPGEPLITALPGSRRAEVLAVLPPMLGALGRIAESAVLDGHGRVETGTVSVLLPAGPSVRRDVEHVLRSHRDGAVRVHLLDTAERHRAYRASVLALACCGTVNVELALAATPQVAAWRANWLTHLIVRRVLRPTVPHATLPNLLAHHQRHGTLAGISSGAIIDECLFERCAAGPIAEAALRLLTCRAAAARQVAALSDVAEGLTALDDAGAAVLPSTLAARALLRHVRQRFPEHCVHL